MRVGERGLAAACIFVFGYYISMPEAENPLAFVLAFTFTTAWKTLTYACRKYQRYLMELFLQCLMGTEGARLQSCARSS
jgi:hypothetical protein